MEKAKKDAKGHGETIVLQIPMVCTTVEVY